MHVEEGVYVQVVDTVSQRYAQASVYFSYIERQIGALDAYLGAICPCKIASALSAAVVSDIACWCVVLQ